MASKPNIKWNITLTWSLTITNRAPNTSLRRALVRSAALAVAHSIGGLELFLFSTNVGVIGGAIHSCAN